MKNKLITILFAIIAVCAVAFYVCFGKINTLKKQLQSSKINELAYIQENSSLKNKSIEFQYTIDELKHNNDSIVNEMLEVKKQLKVKDKELLALAYLQSLAQIHDTISFRDTLFVESVNIDTTIKNDWYTVGLGLRYPNSIGVDIKVPSKKYIVSSSKKVLLNPTGCKLRNFFKKKSRIVEIEVVEKNPYIISEKQKFIEIIK